MLDGISKAQEAKTKIKRTFCGIGQSPPGVSSNWDKTRKGIEILSTPRRMDLLSKPWNGGLGARLLKMWVGLRLLYIWYHHFGPSHRPRTKGQILCLRLQKQGTTAERPKTDWGIGSGPPVGGSGFQRNNLRFHTARCALLASRTRVGFPMTIA